MKMTLVQLIYSNLVETVDVKKYWNLTQSYSNYRVVLQLGKLKPSVDYCGNLDLSIIWKCEKVGKGAWADWLFPV